jgi:hypothetical protein
MRHVNIKKAENGGYIIEAYSPSPKDNTSYIAKDWTEAVDVLSKIFEEAR